MRKAVSLIVVSVALLAGSASSAFADGLPTLFPGWAPSIGIGHSGGLETEEEFSTRSFSAVEGDRVQYAAGDVLYEPHVYAIFMGSNWNIPANSAIRSQLQNLYLEISGSAWQGILTQYFGKEGIVSHSVASTFYTDASVQFSNPFDGAVGSEADKVVKSQGWNLSAANDQVVVLLSPGTFSGSPAGVGFCAGHSTRGINGVQVSYSTVPYLGDSIFAGCVGYGYGDPVKATSMAASHEYAESVSDPFFGGWSGPGNEEEVADLCVGSNAQQLPTGGWVNELWDNEQGRCSLSDPNPPALHGVTGSATGVTTTEATLSGKVNPGGKEASYYFEYGTSPFTYGSKVPVSPKSIGSGTSDIEVSQVATGLKPGTVYHWRVTVTNPRGTTHGHDATFTTEGPPIVTTVFPATEVTKNSATLKGTVNPNGKEASYYFEYGLTTSYGSKTPEVFGIGSGTSDVPVSAKITGLASKTTYHFRVVASNGYGTANGVDKTLLTKPSPPVISTDGADGISAGKATVHGTVNPEGFKTTYFFEYGETSYGSKTAEISLEAGTTPIEVSASLSGLKEGTQYKYRLHAISSEGDVTDSTLHTFSTLKLPTAKTEPASNLETALPRLNATINPNGSETRYWFEYGLTEAYGSMIPIFPGSVGSETSPVAVSKVLGGLKQQATYHFRVVAESDAGTVYGTDQSFTTVGTKASTEAATAVTDSGARLNGTVNPEGVESSYQFEYGTTTAYGQLAPVEPKSAGKGTFDMKISQTASGLKPGTTYHFRLIASNAEIGTVYGADQTFTTSAIVHWFACTKQSGGRYSSSKCAAEGAPNEWESLKLKEGEKSTIAAKGNPIAFTSTQAGITGAFSCETEVTGATLENPSGGGDGTGSAEVKYKGCKAEGKWAEKGCKVTPGAGIATKLDVAVIDGKAEVTLAPKSGETLASFTFAECSNGALNGVWEMKGSMRGLYSNAASQIEFNAETTAQVSLTQRGQKTTAVGTIGLEASGGYVRAENAPVAITEAASALKPTEATLNGTVNPEGTDTHYQFEYGKTTSYGQVAPAVTTDVGEGLADVKVAEVIGSLLPGTTYHYRLMATNGAATAYGVDKTLTTTVASLHWSTCTKQTGGRYTSSTCATEGSPNEWESVRLKEGEKATVSGTGKLITFASTQAGIKGSFGCEAEWSGASLENPTGGGSGVGSAEIKFKGCKAEGTWGEKGCLVEYNSSAPLSLALTSVEGKTLLSLKPKEGTLLAKFTFSKCANGALNGTWELTTSSATNGLYLNASSKLEFNSEVSKEVKTRGQVTTVTGSIGLATASGGYVSAAPEIHWFACSKQAGGKYASATCAKEGSPNEWESLLLKAGEKTTITAKGNPIAFTSTQAGLKTVFSCETEVASPSLENPSGGGSGIGNAEVKYKGCKAEGTAAEKGCKVENTANFASKLELAMIGGKTLVMLKPTSGEVFAKFSFSSCSNGALNGTYELKGTMQGLYSNANSKIEFSTESTGESSLTLRGQVATAVGSLGLEASGGGFVRGE